MLRDRKLSVHGLSTNGKQVENLDLAWFREVTSQADPASLFAATPSVIATRIALVLGLAQDVEMAVAEMSGGFLHSELEKPFYVKPPVEY